MKARLRELKGKYYGTEVEIFDDNDVSVGVAQIWLSPNTDDDYAMSEREVEHARVVLEMPTESLEELRAEWVCDSHYENRLSYTVAQKLIAAINE